MSRRICFILVGLCFTVLLVAACSGATQPVATSPTTSSSASRPTVAVPTKAPTPEPTATTPPTAEPTAPPAQLAALSGTSIDMNNPIFKAYYAVYNKFPRRMRAEAFDPKTKKTGTILMETDSKDHLHLEMVGIGATDALTMSLVVISPTTYLKQGTTWQKLPRAESGMILGMLTDADSLQQMLNAFGELANYTVTPIGPENVNGVPAMAYSSEFTLKDGKVSKGKAWLGPDGLLVGDHIEMSDGTVVTTTYEFDPNIKVEAPIP